MKQLNTLIWLIFVACSCIVFIDVTGCKREQEHPSAGFKVGAVSKPIEEMAPDAVIVSVNGVALTREAYDDGVALKEALHQLTRPQATPQEFKALRPFWSQSVVKEFVARQVILQEARTKKHQASPAAIQAIRSDMCKLLKVEEDGLEKKFTEMGRVGRGLAQFMAENALIRSFREAEHQQKLTVSNEQVDAYLAKVKAYQEVCEATNKLVIAKGKALCEQLKSGEDFIKLAEQYSEVKDNPVGEWGTFVKGEIEHAQLRDAAFSIPVGAVSEPIDTAEGLVIIKVFSRSIEVLGPTTVSTGPSTVKLGRILLRMADGGLHVPPPSREEVEKMILEQRVKNVQNEWIPALAAKVLIEYPNGTNLWKVAERTVPGKRRGMKIQNKEENP
jgi:hypothetical protein